MEKIGDNRNTYMQDNKGADLRFEVMHDISEWNGKFRA